MSRCVLPRNHRRCGLAHANGASLVDVGSERPRTRDASGFCIVSKGEAGQFSKGEVSQLPRLALMASDAHGNRLRAWSGSSCAEPECRGDPRRSSSQDEIQADEQSIADGAARSPTIPRVKLGSGSGFGSMPTGYAQARGKAVATRRAVRGPPWGRTVIAHAKAWSRFRRRATRRGRRERNGPPASSWANGPRYDLEDAENDPG